MITLSIDPSSKSTGLAVFEQNKLIHYQCISDSSTDTYKRIQIMVKAIDKICLKYNPTDIIIQDVIPQDVKNNNNVYKVLIYLQAAIVLQLYTRGKKVQFYTASHWRSLVNIKTGPGIKRDSLKQTSQRLIKSIYNIDVNNDVSDAILIGIAYIKQHRSAF